MRPAAILLALAAAMPLAAQELPLLNGGFEDWEGALPAGWTVPGGALGQRVVVARSAEPAAGRAALRLVSRNPGAPERAWAAVLRQGPLPGLAGAGVCRVGFLARGDADGQALTVTLYAEPGPAGHWFRSHELRLGTAWRRQTVEVPLPADGAGRPLALQFQQLGGAVELDEVQLELRPAPAPAALRRRNLLDDPGFEVGGEAWTCTAWNNGSDELPRVVEDRPRSGRRCLLLPGAGESLESRRHPLTAGRTYTLSAWVRALAPPPAGGGPGFRLFLLTPAWKRALLTVPAADLGTDWQRHRLSFILPAADDPYAVALTVRLDPAVALAVDDLQLEEGAQAGDYGDGVQLGLGVQAADGVAAPGTLAGTARFCLDAARACRLRLAAGDVRGALLWQQESALGTVGPGPGEQPWSAAIARLGVVQVQGELVAADTGEVLASAAARALVADGAPAPNPLIGIDNQPLRLPAARTAQVERLAAAVLGAGCARVFFESVAGVRWGMAEDGADYLAIARRLLDPGLQHRRPLMVCLEPDRTSPLRLRRMREAGRAPDEPAFATAVAAYAERAGRVAAGMRGIVASIELLNEPNIWDLAGGAGMPPERYARMAAAASAAIRAAAPDMAVAANVNGVDLAYLGAFLRAGGAAAVDLVTVHPYRAGPETPPIHDDLLRLRALLDGIRPGLGLASSEQYYGSREDPFANWDEYGRSYIADREAEQAARSLQSLLHACAAGAPYTLFAPERTLYRPTLEGMRWFFAAGMVRQLARVLAGVRAGSPVAVHPACRAFLFARPDGVRVVAVAAREHGRGGTLVLPAGCSAGDAEGNPLAGPRVAIDDLPTYLSFAPGPSDGAIAARLAAAAWLGFDFPLALRLERAGDELVAVVANRGLVAAGGEIAVLEAPAGWPRPAFTVPPLAAGGSHRQPLVRLPAWPGPGDACGVRWRGTSGDEVGTGWSRLPVLRIPRRDGRWPEGAWMALGEAALSRDFADGRRPDRGPADLSAQVALAWDEAGLHLAVAVADDVRAGPPADPALLWRSDSLQVYLDPRDAAQGGRRGCSRGDAVWLLGPDRAGGTVCRLERNPGDRYVGAENAETGPDPLLQARWQASAGGWSARLLIPPAAMPGLRLEPGARCGLALLINDDDGEGRKPGLVLGASGGEPYEQPWSWPCAELGA
jgi:hypothetical protein